MHRSCLLLLLLPLLAAYTDPALCTASTSFYSPVLLSCTTCPTNTVQSSADFTHCNCSTSFSHNPSIIGVNDSSACFSLGVPHPPPRPPTPPPPKSHPSTPSTELSLPA